MTPVAKTRAAMLEAVSKLARARSYHSAGRLSRKQLAAAKHAADRAVKEYSATALGGEHRAVSIHAGAAVRRRQVDGMTTEDSEMAQVFITPGDYLARVMTRANLTASDIASATGEEVAEIEAVIAGRSQMDGMLAAKVSKLLGIDYDVLASLSAASRQGNRNRI